MQNLIGSACNVVHYYLVYSTILSMCWTPVRAVEMVKLIEVHINEAKVSVETVLLKTQKVKRISVKSLLTKTGTR